MSSRKRTRQLLPVEIIATQLDKFVLDGSVVLDHKEDALIHEGSIHFRKFVTVTMDMVKLMLDICRTDLVFTARDDHIIVEFGKQIPQARVEAFMNLNHVADTQDPIPGVETHLSPARMKRYLSMYSHAVRCLAITRVPTCRVQRGLIVYSAPVQSAWSNELMHLVKAAPDDTARVIFSAKGNEIAVQVTNRI